MTVSGLIQASLIRRYKRFLADVRMTSGEVLTVHCPNTGSMKNCVEEGADVWLSHSDSKTRKYPHTWELTRTRRGDYIGINTGKANSIVEQGVKDGVVKELSGYGEIAREVKYGRENSRIDLFLSGHGTRQNCYVEVKSVTLLEAPVSKGIGYFPDAVSERGAKHLRELIAVKQAGFRAMLLFCVQHSGIREVRPADHIDPEYGRLLRDAQKKGVEIIAYKSRVTNGCFKLWRSLPVNLS